MDDYLEEIVSAKFDELDYLESLDDIRDSNNDDAYLDDDIDTELMANFSDE
jgi:hypothetical protein